MKPEMELLLCCAGSRWEADGARRAQGLLRGTLDGPRLLHLAESHGLLPWSYVRLKTLETPGDLLASWELRVRENTQHNLNLTGELLTLLALLAEAGIPAVPYKGPFLALALYGDLGLRQSVDLDLLVRPRDLSKTQTLLLQRGYRPHLLLNPSQEGSYRRSHAEREWQAPGGIMVDLHWGFSPRRLALDLRTGAIWARLERQDLPGGNGEKVLGFPPEDLLLLLCIHGAKDCWSRLIWLSDLARLLETSAPLDWQLLLARARAAGALRMLTLGLRLARDLLGSPLPPEALRAVDQDAALDPLSGRVGLWLQAQERRRPQDVVRFQLALRERPRDRALFCLRQAFLTGPRDWHALPLPHPLQGIHPILRPIRLAARYALPALKEWTDWASQSAR